MFRNKEVKRTLLILLIIGITATIVSAIFSKVAAISVGFTSTMLIIVMLIMTKRRYQKIAELSNYLRKISEGDYHFDVRDNTEGELSILKNDLHRMTRMLSEQQNLLQTDKIQLMDAISDISHQLKTPLTSMTVMADLLEQENLPKAKRKQFVHNVQIQLDRMEWLVTSLLKLSKIDAGAITFRKDDVNIRKLFEEVLQNFAIAIDVKQIETSLEGEADVHFLGDEQWTKEALLNIMKNNIEHIPEGAKIQIRFANNPLYTEIIIHDTGNGIAEEDLPYIFKRFYRGKNANESSVGIGLAIAHEIITNQNGLIEVKSNAQEGTTFTIKFYKKVV